MDSNTTNNGDNQMNTDANIPESFKQFLASGESVIQACRELMEENARLRNENAAMTDAFGYVPCMLDAIVTSFDGSSGVEWNEVKEWVEKLVSSAKSAGVGLYCLPDLVKDSGEKSEPPADYQTLKDFKGEMDAIHEEFDIPHDVDALRKELQMAKTIAEMIEAKTDVDFSVDVWAKDLDEILDDYNAYKQAADNHCVDPDELDSKLEDADNYESVCDDHGITDSGDLEDALTEWEDMKKYKEGFKKLAAFVDRFKEFIGSRGDDIPSTDVEDYD